MAEGDPEAFTAKRGLIAAALALPLWIIVGVLSDWGRARAAAICFGMLIGVAMITPSARNQRWYIPVLVFLFLIHAALIVFIPWSDASYPGGTLVPVALADFLLCLGCIKLAENLTKRFAKHS